MTEEHIVDQDSRASHAAIEGSTTRTSANRMSKAEIDAFLNEPHIGRLATIRADGFPHQTPIWFGWDGEKILFSLALSRIHTKNLKVNPKASIIVDDDWRPREKRFAAGAAAVVIRGEVTLLDLDVSDRLHSEMFISHAHKFLDGAADDIDYWRTESVEPYHVCHLNPQKIISWDFRKVEYNGERTTAK